MEERTPPGDHDVNRKNDHDNQELALAISPQPSHHHYEPYIIQFPREQIFSKPPPENGKFIERKLNEENNNNNNDNKNTKKKKKKKGAFCGCCCITVSIILFLLVILVIVGAYLVTMFFKANPAGPEFSVKDMFIKKHKKSKMYPPPPTPPPTFNLTLAANPIIRKGIKIHYPSTGTAMISYKKTKIANGKFPASDLDGKEEGPVTIRLFLNALKGESALPKEIQESLKFDSTVNEQGEMIPITMDLEMTAPVTVEKYSLQKMNFHMDVKCNFKLNTLGDGSKVTRQHCEETRLRKEKEE